MCNPRSAHDDLEEFAHQTVRQAIPERVFIPECYGASSRCDYSPVPFLCLTPHHSLQLADVAPKLQLLVIVEFAIEYLRVSGTAVGITYLHQGSSKEVAILLVLPLVAMIERVVCRKTYAEFLVTRRQNEFVIACLL
jgi:hypothetical protein